MAEGPEDEGCTNLTSRSTRQEGRGRLQRDGYDVTGRDWERRGGASPKMGEPLGKGVGDGGQEGTRLFGHTLQRVASRDCA